ncbi:TetR/AcrR family transcriptional regulator [Georgenia yuyongxinii]|uniref:TetR/AcrR family transcriptional regulator n=1 Tax=Georgenia yuyongxinii TaxID=2589797 RepID=UPI00163DB38E|nr:TetR/AcrR family transcriptional regulator [Georgenia yuyongxinii]
MTIEPESPGTPGRGKTVALSADAIVDCALELARREGSQALTLRRIGKELGADPTAFYRYFRDKDELVLACMDKVLDIAFERYEEDSASLDWRARLRRAAHVFYTVAEEFPTVTALGFARITGGPGERRWVEMVISTLHGVGLPPGLTALHYRAFVDAMLAMSGLRATVHGLPAALADKDDAAWLRVYGALPRDQFPAIRAHSEELVRVEEHDVFSTVVDAVLTNIEVAARAHG